SKPLGNGCRRFASRVEGPRPSPAACRQTAKGDTTAAMDSLLPFWLERRRRARLGCSISEAMGARLLWTGSTPTAPAIPSGSRRVTNLTDPQPRLDLALTTPPA